MKKRKYIFIVLSIFLVVLFVTSAIYFYFFKSINLKYEIIKNSNINVLLNRRLNKCLVNTSIEKNNSIDKIEKYLLKDGYKKKKKIYQKSFNLGLSCSKVIEKYKDIKLNKENSITIEAGKNYEPDDLSKKYKNIKLLEKTDSKKLGTGYDIYEIDNFLFKKYVIKEVLVTDSISPVINLNGNKEINLYVNNKYNEEGFSATDSFEGDLTNNVVISSNVDYSKKGTYSIKYSVSDSSGNNTSIERKINITEKPIVTDTEIVTDLTYIKGILIVNKKYGLPPNYNPGVNQTALAALNKMQSDASKLGLTLNLVSGFRSYQTQKNLYNNYVKKDGVALADTYSARPGHSEHQTGLAFDVGSTKGSFANTKEAKWLAENCHLYGFIIRYPYGKTNITGYIYEPWHVRYLGVDIATEVKESNLSLEEYLGIVN